MVGVSGFVSVATPNQTSEFQIALIDFTLPQFQDRR